MFNIKKVLALKKEIKSKDFEIYELNIERLVNESQISVLELSIEKLNYKLMDVVPVSEIDKVLEYLDNKIRPLKHERKANPSNLKAKEILFAHLNIRKALKDLVEK